MSRITPDLSFAGEPLTVSVRHFAEQWVAFDRQAWTDLHADAAPAIQLDAITRVTKKYRVARSLRRKYDVGAGVERFAPLLEAISQLRRDIRRSSAAPALVQRLATLIGREYKVSAISASSKLLWFVMRSPIVIYDDNALKALGVPPGDYATFYAEWQRQFRMRQSDIDLAIKRTSFAGLPADVKSAASEVWFRERVFDIACWRSGDRIKKQASAGRAARTMTPVRRAPRAAPTQGVKTMALETTIEQRLKTWTQRLRKAGERASDPIMADPAYVQVELCGPFAFRLVHRIRPLIRININAASPEQTGAFLEAIATHDMLGYMVDGKIKYPGSSTPYMILKDYVEALDEAPDALFAAIARFRALFCKGK